MALYNGQKGFWVKRAMDTNPQFISVGGADTPDSEVNRYKEEWKRRTGYTGEQAANNVQWVGEDPNRMATDIATGNVTVYKPASVDPVEENYFDTALRLVEEKATEQRSQAQASYNTLVQQLKESRELFNTNLESEYGKALEQANIDVYARGIGESGIKENIVGDVTGEKEYKSEQQDLLDKQKKEIASQELQDKMANIALQEKSSKFNISASRASDNPYAKYSYT